MAIKLQNIVLAFVVFVALIGGVSDIYEDFKDGYSLTENNLQDPNNTGTNVNIMEAFQETILLSSLDDMKNALLKITNPDNALDLIGGFLVLGFSVIKTITVGLITFPGEVIRIISEYYLGMPSAVGSFVSMFITFILGFILLKTATGRDN